jgi:hypothetical protein
MIFDADHPLRRHVHDELRRHLVPTLWTTFDRVGTEIASSAVLEGDRAMRLVFVHGIRQRGKDPTTLKRKWLKALTDGLQAFAVGPHLPGISDPVVEGGA